MSTTVGICFSQVFISKGTSTGIQWGVIHCRVSNCHSRDEFGMEPEMWSSPLSQRGWLRVVRTNPIAEFEYKIKDRRYRAQNLRSRVSEYLYLRE